MERIYACIDLKSFYASCECVERKLNPITTNLVVADSERTEKTICLAVSPSLKSYGLPGRARLYEVVSKVNAINKERLKNSSLNKFTGKSYNNEKIKLNPNIELDYIIAKPRMSLYMQYSSRIYSVYLKYLSEDDIHVYSIDEVFCDITNYLKYQNISPEEFVTKIILDIIKETGITATGGIGTNLYLAKVAMDVMAKHVKPNKDNVRIAFLDEKLYREKLWEHEPITDFWRVGKGYAKKLLDNNIKTMGDVAKISLEDEELLYKLFGINAELLIDHAWGYEPCTILDIKNYRPINNSISSSQVLDRPYDYQNAKIIVSEMLDNLVLELVEKELVTKQVILSIGYDIENINPTFQGRIKKDYYGRKVPESAHGSVNLPHYTSSFKLMNSYVLSLYSKIVDPKLSIRRVTIAFANVIKRSNLVDIVSYEQFDLFGNLEKKINEENLQKEDENIENTAQKTIINLKKKYGRNAILKGINLLPSARGRERNSQIGGHHE